jgi:predicted GNAT family N-acyltransferase
MKLAAEKLLLDDLSFFEELLNESSEWLEEEGHLSVDEIVAKYHDLNGQWLKWSLGNHTVAISFLVWRSPSNQRPWIGTVLVRENMRGKGIGKSILVELINSLKKDDNKVVYAAIPMEKDNWLQFMTSCGFEQYKIDKDENNKKYLLLICPL